MSYTCENFQLFILYKFQFHHVVLKRLPEDLIISSIFDFFQEAWLFYSCSFLFLFDGMLEKVLET